MRLNIKLEKVIFNKTERPSNITKFTDVKNVYIGKSNNLIYLVTDENEKVYIINSDNEEKVLLPGKIKDIQDIINIQDIGDSKWLIAYYDEDVANMICIFDNFGKIINEILIGEGVQDCQLDIKNNIWISFSDEGIFSGEELSENGLVALDIEGNVVFNNYEQIVQEKNVPPIDDCYALNVINDEVCLYYYSEFPVVQLENQVLKNYWENIYLEEQTVQTFALGKEAILFCTNNNSLLLYSLTEKTINKVTPYDQNGSQLIFTNCLCKGSSIYLETNKGVYTYQVS